jgi:F-type H+-transporting ATPase subunit b
VFSLSLQEAAAGGRIAEIASTFGVDWPHLIAQMVSFGIVCAVLYLAAYRPVLRLLEARREQIAGGLANAERIKAELARIELDRQQVLRRAEAEGKALIEDARAAAARVRAEEGRKAVAQAEQIVARAREAAERERTQMRSDLRQEIGRLVVQTTAAVAGKVLTREDHARLNAESARHLGAETA